METESYKTLNTSMAAFTETWKKATKETICKVADLEIENTKKEIIQIFVTTAKQIAKLLLLQDDPDSELKEILMVTCAMLTHGCTLTKHLGATRATVIHKLYEPQLFIETTLTTEIREEYDTFIPKLVKLLTAAFVDSWDAQLQVHHTQASERAMTKQAREFLDGAATQQAAAAMDIEPSADPTLLKDFIWHEMNNQQKKLQQDMNTFKQFMARSSKQNDSSPKNKSRGASTQQQKQKQKQKGASSTKKSPVSTAKKPPPTKPRGGLKKDATADCPERASLPVKASIKLTKKVNSRYRNVQFTKDSKKPASKK